MSMNATETTNHYLTQAFDLLELSPRYKTLLLTPSRELRVEIAIELDDGNIGNFIGYRIQHRPRCRPRRYRFVGWKAR